MTLHLLQLHPDLQRLIRWAHSERLLRASYNGHRQDADDLGYVLHAAMHAVFGNHLAPKPFTFLQPVRREPQLLAYSEPHADLLHEYAATFATPEASQIFDLPMHFKTMPDYFVTGCRLGFSVRVRPVLRTDRNGDRSRTREIDAFLAASLCKPGNHRLNRDEVYRTWISERLCQGGVAIEHLALIAFRRTRVMRRSRRTDLKSLVLQEGPDATFEGVLSVSDPEAFRRLLVRGIGRHRAFGFGMVLLRPTRG